MTLTQQPNPTHPSPGGERPATHARHRRLPTPWAWLDERATAGIALGVAGLFLFNIICGPFAIGLGLAAHRRATGRAGRIAALITVALGVADLVVLAALTASKVHDGQFVWQSH
jgi:hypothetical protein